MHPATALDIKTRGSWLYQRSKVQTYYTMELKTRQGKYGGKEGGLCADPKKKILLLKVENKLVMRYKVLNLANQSYTKDPIGVNKMFTI